MARIQQVTQCHDLGPLSFDSYRFVPTLSHFDCNVAGGTPYRYYIGMIVQPNLNIKVLWRKGWGSEIIIVLSNFQAEGVSSALQNLHCFHKQTETETLKPKLNLSLFL